MSETVLCLAVNERDGKATVREMSVMEFGTSAG